MSRGEFGINPMKYNNSKLVASQIELMNKHAVLENYDLAIMYRRMIYNCETFFGRFPEDAEVSKDFPENKTNIEKQLKLFL